jgi:phosphoinositide-3-kinase regulatory subunit 4
VDVNVNPDVRRLRAEIEGPSRRTSFASRSAKGVDNPLDEIRKRLASLEPSSRIVDKDKDKDRSITEPSLPQTDDSPSESAISSSLDLSAMPRTGKRKADAKGAPAVGAVHTTVTGMTSLHDETASGRSTPTISGKKGPLAPYSSSYEGQDPGVKAFLEQVDLENYREPLLDFGPRVGGSQRKRGLRLQKTPSSGVTLIAHLTHHTSEITSIVTSPDQAFFATASEDGQILVWDSAKLERSVSGKPRLVYKMQDAVSCMCRIENTHCLAACAENGELAVLRVHVSTGSGGSGFKWGKVECIRSWKADRRDGFVKYVSHLRGELTMRAS